MDLGSGFCLFKQGAEARLYTGTYLGKPVVVKERFQKKYRNTELDDYLTRERIKAEVRSFMRCKTAGICTPAVYLVDIERRCIFMENILNGQLVKDFVVNVTNGEEVDFNKSEEEVVIKLNTLASEIGKLLGKMHSNGIIHGDLTTSNMLLVTENDKFLKLVLIDFGLSHVESSAEDKGVDLYVLERALLSTHANATHIFPLIVESYVREYGKGCRDVIAKLDEVRSRGRKRTMVG